MACKHLAGLVDSIELAIRCAWIVARNLIPYFDEIGFRTRSPMDGPHQP
jgi:hypothetical protein